MRLEKISLILTVMFFFSVPGFSYGAVIAKIGVVDFQKILSTSDAGKSAQSEINKQGKKMEAGLKEKGDEIEEIKKKLERESLVMSKESRSEREREIRIKINDFKALKKRFANDFKLLEKKLVNQIQKDIFKIVEEIGKKEGYLLVIEKREGGVLYFPNTIDITDKLIHQYNAEYALKSEAEKKKE